MPKYPEDFKSHYEGMPATDTQIQRYVDLVLEAAARGESEFLIRDRNIISFYDFGTDRIWVYKMEKVSRPIYLRELLKGKKDD